MAKWLACSILLLSLAASALAVDWDLKSDTWTATDALGRRLPGSTECGLPRKDRYVGVFYFLWLGEHGQGGPYDITKILAASQTDPRYGPVGSFHHWGESELGYYLSTDPYVIRKHCAMLTNAGVDTLIFDATNAFTYPANYLKLCAIFSRIRKEGGHTPQICFLTHSHSGKVVQELYDSFYSRNLYSDLWFRWQGKPLILGTPAELTPRLNEYFTVRYCWYGHDPKDWFGDGKDRWTWLDPYPQEPGWHENGVPEEMSVGIAALALAAVGRSNDGKRQPGGMSETGKGIYFAREWERALEVGPKFIFITGWNEWVAMRNIDTKNGNSYFVDEYNQEYSRDAEPMKGGHTDNYYYQMASYIRRFKGVRPLELATGPSKITIDGKFNDWVGVEPEFRDMPGDTEHRNWKGWGSAGPYVNNTGRNDFVRLKVAYDPNYVCFYTETRNVITSRKQPNWMLLFIDADCNPSTGWHGYDYLVNYKVTGPTTTSLMRTSSGWDWKQVSTVRYQVAGNKMEIRIPRRELGLSGKKVKLDFHWADNIQKTDDIIEFAVSGDSAPDRRFNYHFEQK